MLLTGWTVESESTFSFGSSSVTLFLDLGKKLLLKTIRLMRDGFGKMHCKKLIIFVGSSPSQGDIFF